MQTGSGLTCNALMPRRWRHPRLDHPILNSNAGCDLPATPLLATLARRFRLTRVLHATGLDPRPAIQTLQLSVLLPKVRDQLLLLGHFAQQLHHQRFQRCER
jgi:hypothetical protein